MNRIINFFSGNNEDLCKLIGLPEEAVWRKLSLDDWDYALIVNGKLNQDEKDELERLLTGCCDNEIHFLNKKTIGIAYHS